MEIQSQFTSLEIEKDEVQNGPGDVTPYIPFESKLNSSFKKLDHGRNASMVLERGDYSSFLLTPQKQKQEMPVFN